ncbi:MAG: LPS-assembly protein LptD [Pseudomonadota bacterium]
MAAKDGRVGEGMGRWPRTSTSRLRALSLPAALAFACLMTSVAAPVPGHQARAQSTLPSEPTVITANDQLALEADQLIYRRATEEIEAVGGVDILYQGNRLVADRVIYNRNTGRVEARGNVELFDGSGNVLRAQVIDVTDDFSRGFVEAVELRTQQYGEFQATRGERVSDTRYEFQDGYYRPCRVCEANRDKPPLWSLRAKTIIIDEDEATVVYRDATFALFGQPIATLPYFRHADPRISRSTGFLRPEFGYSDERGPSVGIPYFMVLSDRTDLTIAGTAFARQGFLLDTEFRQRLDDTPLGTGTYTLRSAGIYQLTPGAFSPGSVDSRKRWRGLIATTGQFKPGTNWAFDWNIVMQSDRTFGRTYGVRGYQDEVLTNNVSLTGLEGTSYFDLSGYQFLVQESFDFQDRQALVTPQLTYEKTLAEGDWGRLQFTARGSNMYRDAQDAQNVPGDVKFEGLEGRAGRLASEFIWSAKFTGGGMVFKPLLAARGDVYSYQTSTAAGIANADAGATGMVTAGLEVSYPLLVSAPGSTHIIEPVAQLYVRPNERIAGQLPNNDAHSIIFDSTSLFDRDKFNAVDRVEGGTRLNYGLRYSASFDNGLSLAAIAGQSWHVAGRNSYAVQDIANSTSQSGLETTLSDFVAGLSVGFSDVASVDARLRYDQHGSRLARAEVEGTLYSKDLELGLGYTFVDAQPLLGFVSDRHELSGSMRANLTENWVFGLGASYDFSGGSFVTSNALLGYQADAGYFGVTYSREEPGYTTNQINQSFEFEVRLFPFD